MSFTTIEYLVFLMIVFTIYWIIPHKIRWIILLVSSCYFYMQWNVRYILLIAFAIVVSYTAGLLIEKFKIIIIKKVLLTLSIILCLSVLFVFKYFNFFMDSIHQVGTLFGTHIPDYYVSFVLPVGISFYTFQVISYVIDTYRTNICAEKNIGKYATYVLFFPQLVAGPIERCTNLIPQLEKEKKFDYIKAVLGLEQMLLGYLKKVVIADTLAIYVDKVYSNIAEYSGFAYIIVAVMFSLQIYCDFSGYSDIAIGTAKLFGIDLMTNFKSPYLSKSIHEFWSRWHISLSTWMKDYIYIPLGGNRKGKLRRSVNLVVTFLVSGLWHGASWTYVFWGGLHGVGQVFENIILSKKEKAPKKKNFYVLKIGLIFSFVTICWVFFRAQNLSDAVHIIMGAFNGIDDPVKYVINGIKMLDGTKSDLLKITIGCILLFLSDIIAQKKDLFVSIRKLPWFLRWGIYYFVSLIVLFCWSAQGVQFIYFQF